MRYATLALALLVLHGCQRSPDEVFDKVMVDFGLQEAPEGHVSMTDRVYAQLDTISKSEIKRMNSADRQGEIHFREDGLHGSYYKEVKRYEKAYPLDAQAVAKTAEGTRGYVGYIEYDYRIYQSRHEPTRAEASAESANIATTESGREVYRYKFNSAGIWTGGEGEKARR